MIERKIGEGKIQTFIPDQIPTELPNLVYIEGPNSSGKSTLLNIIALGLLGVKSRRMNPILLRRMNSLLNSEYQKLKFKIEIASENEDLVLRSRKENPNRSEVILEESIDGEPFKPISFEKFESKYNLIYDIPENPTERLYDLLQELKEEQLRYGNKFKDFGLFLRNTLKDITQYRDPKRLEELKRKVEQTGQQRKQLIEELPGLESFLDLLEKHVYVKFYYYYLNECETLERTKEEIEEKSRGLRKSGKKLIERAGRLKKEIMELQNTISTNYNEVTPLISAALPKNEKKRFEIWKGVNPYDNDDFELNRIRIEAIYLLDLFRRKSEKIQSDNAFKEANTLERIIQSLEEFSNSSIVIPRIEMTVKELIETLKEETKKNYFLISEYENLSRIIGLLDNLKSNIDIIQSKLKEIRETSVDSSELAGHYSESYYKDRNQLANIISDLNVAVGKRDNYFEKCIGKDIDRDLLEKSPFLEVYRTLPKKDELEPFMSLNEKQIQAKISGLNKEISEKRDDMRSYGIYIEQYQREIEQLEKQKPHKYENYQTQLSSLLKKTDSLSQKLLDEYNNNIKSLIDREVKETDLEKSEHKARYYQEVSRYLAHKIGSFRHVNTTYKAETVDLISGVITTDDNITIHLADMGTGQSQSAYLLGLLNVQNDTRKIIALFDEIAMMDDRSLEPIYNRMRELYKNKKLLLGIMVQKGNNIKIRPL